jgi:sialic acid synthase SpsE
MAESSYGAPRVVAEIGCNHLGKMEIAKELIELAKLCGVGYVKFQKRTVKELLTPEQYSTPHPVPWNSYGETYGAHREYLEFDQAQHAELLAHCRQVGIEYSTSVWDATSAREIMEIEPAFIKVPSACNQHYEMLRILRDEYQGQVQASLGMTTREEERRLVEFFEETGAARERLILYACTSGYPVPFEDVCLLEVTRIREEYGDRVAGLGFSGHHLGIAMDVAAYVLGAQWIERHFTKDRTLKGTDHAASLEPSGLQKLARDLQATQKALTLKRAEILDIEAAQREKLKYREGGTEKA